MSFTPSKQATVNVSKQKPRTVRAASIPSHVFTEYVGTLKAKPQDKRKLSLGNFTPDRPAKGYSIKLKSRGDTEDPSINADIVMSGNPERRYELMLHLDNGTDRTVSAEIWEMR